jgi:hypothetical protein
MPSIEACRERGGKWRVVCKGVGRPERVCGCAETQNGAISERVEPNLAQDVNLTEAEGCP